MRYFRIEEKGTLHTANFDYNIGTQCSLKIILRCCFKMQKNPWLPLINYFYMGCKIMYILVSSIVSAAYFSLKLLSSVILMNAKETSFDLIVNKDGGGRRKQYLKV